MTIESLLPWAATVASGISIYVSLYVRSAVGPILTEIATHRQELERRRVGESHQWDAISQLRERLAHLEAKINGKGQ